MFDGVRRPRKEFEKPFGSAQRSQKVVQSLFKRFSGPTHPLKRLPKTFPKRFSNVFICSAVPGVVLDSFHYKYYFAG
jgi:hypothetical protein